MSRPLLTPLGAARAAIGAQPPRDLPPFPEDLAAIARAADLGEERLHVAWELARALPRVSGDDARGLLVLLLLLFDAIAQGSTRLALAPSSRRVLEQRAAALGLGRADVRRAEACADAILVGVGTVVSDARGQLEIAFGDAENARTPYAALIGEPGARRPLLVDGKALVPQRLLALEVRLAARLLERAPPRPDDAAIDRAVEEVLADPVLGPRGPIALTAEQAAAVRAAIRGPVAVISGGPGTGKTSIVVSILRALARLAAGAGEPPELAARAIALAAPTGKAADRLAQSIAGALDRCADPIDRALRAALSEARTLHRLLAWSPGEERFRADEESPLGERFVIVDEASMIDLSLMERLVAALRSDARLVLLGDADQLPSVEPGAVLADLVLGQDAASPGARAITIARLTHSHRMDPSDRAGSHILGIARAVNAGEALPVVDEALVPGTIRRVLAPSDALEGVAAISLGDRLEDRRRGGGHAAREAWLTWWYEHRVRGPESERGVLDRSFLFASASPTEPASERDPARAEAATLRRLFDRLESSRLLCVTRGRATGADAINAWMGARLARERRVVSSALLLVGEPVMVVRNDYERGLFNGDQGLVLWARDEGGATARPALVVRRGDRFVAHRIEAVRALLERAYATTVHKAQGSEHDAVALVLPEEDVPRLLTREIVYTAITRARRSVLLVGSTELLAKAIARPAARTTGLAARLRGGA